ncbi:hypothetical protein IFM89_017077 [Coptis chinensis]|uniref:Lipocalin/cytosolic fatty-acid binding domain-containing protein n=1 Tax=Coptis chinensis TaxID=261450 RepID=A0A835M878_9MAGN|nr:hypothetical protein IFM89_017077 [Coptis chinensis]
MKMKKMSLCMQFEEGEYINDEWTSKSSLNEEQIENSAENDRWKPDDGYELLEDMKRIEATTAQNDVQDKHKNVDQETIQFVEGTLDVIFGKKTTKDELKITNEVRLLNSDVMDVNRGMVCEMEQNAGQSMTKGILCRKPHLEEDIYNQLLQRATDEGYDVKKLHKTAQIDPPPEADEAPKDTKGICWIKSIFGK